MFRSVNPLHAIQRRWQVQAIFLRYGFDILISKEQIQEVRQFLTTRLGYRPHEFAHLSVPARVRLMLEELGPTFIKLGQVVSSQTQSLPKEWLAELELLQNNVPPFAFEDVRTMIYENLGAFPEEIYASFDEHALAAASIGQVHRAVLTNGQPVAVKIQRPGIRPDINEDLAILFDTARLLERTTAWARNFDVVGMVTKFAEGLHEELDYLIEAQNTDRLREIMRSFDGVRTPQIDHDHVSSQVLTMEFVQGIKITNVSAIDAAGLDRTVLAERFIQAMIQQVLIYGFFHADPHPGNVMVDTQSGDIIFLDMGMMDLLSDEQRTLLGRLIVAMHERDSAEVTRCAIRLGTVYKELNESVLRRDMGRLLNRYLATDLARIQFGEVVGKILSTLFLHGIRLSSELTLAVKALVQMEQIARTLDPALSMETIVRTAFNELLEHQLSVEEFVNKVQRTAREVVRLGPDMLDAFEGLLQQARNGRLTIQVDADTVAERLQELDRATRRLALGLSLSGLSIGSAIVLQATLQGNSTALRRLASGSFTLATLANGALVAAVIRDIWRRNQAG